MSQRCPFGEAPPSKGARSRSMDSVKDGRFVGLLTIENREFFWVDARSSNFLLIVMRIATLGRGFVLHQYSSCFVQISRFPARSDGTKVCRDWLRVERTLSCAWQSWARDCLSFGKEGPRAGGVGFQCVGTTNLTPRNSSLDVRGEDLGEIRKPICHLCVPCNNSKDPSWMTNEASLACWPSS